MKMMTYVTDALLTLKSPESDVSTYASTGQSRIRGRNASEQNDLFIAKSASP